MFVRSTRLESARCRCSSSSRWARAETSEAAARAARRGPLPGGEAARRIRRSKVARRSASRRRASRSSRRSCRALLNHAARQRLLRRPRARVGVASRASRSRRRVLRHEPAAGCSPRLQGRRRRSTRTASRLSVDERNRRSTSTSSTTIDTIDPPRRSRSSASASARATCASTSNNLDGSFDIAFGIKPADGELDIHLAQINTFDAQPQLHRAAASSSSIGNLDRRPRSTRSSASSSIQLLTPMIDSLVQGFLPNPLGIAGMIDVGKLLAGVSPGHRGAAWRRASSPAATSRSTRQRHEPRRDHRPQLRRGSDDAHRHAPDGVPYDSEPTPLRAADPGARTSRAAPLRPADHARATRSRSLRRRRSSTARPIRPPTSRWASRRPRSISPVTTS